MKEETTEKIEDVPEQKVQPEQIKKVMLGEVPTEYGLVYQTPDGVMNEKEYLVWIGNMLLEVKQGLIG